MFDLTSEEARLLLDVALMAIGGNRFKSAEAILSALEAYRPGSEQLAAARMILAISRGELESALEYANVRALPEHPGSAMIKAFAGMALLRLGRVAEAAVPIGEAAAQTDDPAAAQLARDMMT